MKRLGIIIAGIFLTLASFATERKALLLFIQFQDLQFTSTTEQFQGLADSLGLYFNAQFHGEPEFTFARGPLITLEESHSKYSANGTSGADLQMYSAVVKACQQAADSLSIAEYVNHSTSDLKDILVLVPSKSETDSLDTDLFRPQFVNIKGNYYAGRYRIASYGIACELGADGKFCGIGNLAHEYCHILGLSDLYDTDGNNSAGLSPALWGSIGIMDGGNLNGGGHFPPNFCAADYYTLGAGKGEKIDTAGTYTLEPIYIEGRYFIFEGSNDGEVFLAESRIERGWDTLIGGHGLAIYHYDRSSGDAGWSSWDRRNLTAAERWEKNRVNCNPNHQCVELEAPDSSSAFFPCGPIESFASETTPAFRYWDGTISPLAISGITQDAEGVVTFNLIRPIGSVSVMPFQSSVILGWKCDSSIADIDSCLVVCTKGADTLSVSCGVVVEDNVWSCTIDHLAPATTYKVTVKIMKNGSPFFSAGVSASTLSMRSGSFPFIYLKGAERRADGSFVAGTRIPLQVFNASKALEVFWYFQGRRIQPGADGFYILQESGTLKAVIVWEDGSRDVIEKKLEVR